MRSRMAGCWPMAVLLLPPPLALLAYDTSGTRAPIDTAIPDDNPLQQETASQEPEEAAPSRNQDHLLATI